MNKSYNNTTSNNTCLVNKSESKLLSLLILLALIICCTHKTFGNAERALLNGTYTVGVGGNYATLTDAINDYNSSILGGEVIFSLISTTYSVGETFPIIIKKNASASVVNKLIIKPANGLTTTISGAVPNGALIRVLGDFIYLDGSNNGTNSRDITITNTSSMQPRVVLFGSVGTNPVTNCELKNCYLVNGVCDKSILLISDSTMTNPPSPGYFSNINIENNCFKKATYGIYCRGVAAASNGSGVNFIANDLAASGSGDSLQQCGIYLEGTDGVLIKANEIGNFKQLDSVSDKGIFIGVNVMNTNIIGNHIFNINNTSNKGCGAHGIYIGTGINGANIVVANNMIANISGDGNDHTSAVYNLENPAGILLSSSTTQTRISIYHNTIYLGGVAGFKNTLNKVGAVSACIRLKSGSYADIRNNILVNNLGLKDSVGFGATAIMVSSDATQFSKLNYNDYAVSPSGSFGFKLFGYMYASGNKSTSLSAWRTATGKDASSVNITPQFVSPIDLHLINTANNALNNLAVLLQGYDEDFDATSRNLTSTDMGCDEFVPANTANWVGKYSSEWNFQPNWESNVVADENTDIIMTRGNPYLPIISNVAKAKGVTLSGTTNAVLISIDSNSILQVFGSMVKNNGFIDASKGSFGCFGSSSQTIPPLLFLDNKVLNLMIGNNSTDGVLINGYLDVYRSLAFASTGLKLKTNGFLTLKSTETGTASVGDLTGKIVSGDVTVERYIPTGTLHSKSWQLLAVPISGTQTINQAWQDTATLPRQNRFPGYGTIITSNLGGNTAACNALGFDIYTPAGGTLKTYSATDSTWVGVNSTLIPIENKKGYLVLVRGDRSVTTSNTAAVPTVLRAKGKLYTAATGELPPITNIAPNKFECVGNPYASCIDFRYINRSDNVADNTFYVWDPLLAGLNNLGGFQTISSVNGYRPVPGGTVNYNNAVPCTTIQSGQAFFMHATGALSGGAISFSESAKVSGSNNVFRDLNLNHPAATFSSSLYAQYNDSSVLVDGNILVFDSLYLNDYDAMDALKMTNSNENFSIKSNGRFLVVEAKSFPMADDSVFFSMSHLKKQHYQLRLIATGISDINLMPFLYDNYTQTFHLLNLQDTNYYNFFVNDDAASSDEARFYVIFKTATVLPFEFIDVNVINNNNKNKLIWNVSDQQTITNYQVERSFDGVNFTKIGELINNLQSSGSAVYRFEDECLEPGKIFYRIKALRTPIDFFYSKIVSIITAKNRNMLVFPNPVINNTLNLLLTSPINVGQCEYKIVNVSGQVINNGRVNIALPQQKLSLHLDPSIASGKYSIMFYVSSQSSPIFSADFIINN